MSIFSRFADRRRERIVKAAQTSGASAPGISRLAYTWWPRWLRGDYSLRNSELLFAAVSRISNSLSTMPIRMYKGSNPVKNDLNDMVGFEPNPNMTSCQFIKTFEACRCTSGNGYAIKVYDPDGTLARIDILDPLRVTPALDTVSGELYYRINPEQGSEYYIHNFYIIHVPFLSTNGYTGINPVSVLHNTLDYNDSIATFSTEQLKEGLNVKVVLEAPANLGKQQREEMLKDFRETYHETSGNVLLLESGVVAKSLNLSPVDSKIFEVEKITRSKVAMVYNIPPHLLGDYSGSTLKSQEQVMLEFLTLTMLPIVTAYEQELSRKLLTKAQRRNGYRFKFDMDAVLRADAATTAEVNYKAVRSAWKTPDEIRAEYNKPPYPKGIGRHPMISQDMATLDYTVNTKPTVLAGEPVSDPDPPEPDPEDSEEDEE